MASHEAVASFEEGLARVDASYADAFAAATDEQALRHANAKLAGPQGELTLLLKQMPQLPQERRRELGQRANAVKEKVQKAFDTALEALGRAARRAELEGPHLDVTLPGRGRPMGRLHAVTRVREE